MRHNRFTETPVPPAGRGNESARGVRRNYFARRFKLMILFRNGTWQTQLRRCRHVTPRQSRFWSQLCHFTAIHSPSNQCNNNHRMHNYTSHPAACLSLAVTHGCTNTRCARRQRLSNLNRTSAFVCGSLNHHRCVCAAPFLLLNQRDGEEQQVAATLHKYLHISKGQTVQPGEIHRLEAEERASGFCLCARCNHQRAHRERGRATLVNCWFMVDT